MLLKNLKNFCLVVCFVLLQNAVFSQESVSSTEKSSEASNDKKASENIEKLIHLGDLIDVDIVGSSEFDWRGRMNPEGFLDGLEFVENPVYALCRTEEAVAAEIARAYSKLLREPQVVVRIIDRTGRPNSFLYGAVKNPQRFSIQRAVYLNELIALAGGLTDQASGEIQILRPAKLNCVVQEDSSPKMQSQKISTAENPQTFKIKITDLLKGAREFNPKIENGDIITVEETAPVYVIGGVVNPKSINTSGNLTVSRAIASAGGLVKKGNEENVSVYRRTGAETKIIKINLKTVKEGKAEDVLLQKYDIVEVGQSGEDERKKPPVIQRENNSAKKNAEMPLRIIS